MALGSRRIEGRRRAENKGETTSAVSPVFGPDREVVAQVAVGCRSGDTDVVIPDIRYVRREGVSVAYQVFGDGPELLFIPGFVSNLEYQWQFELTARFFERLGSFSRVIEVDRRGTGLSDRLSPVAFAATRGAGRGPGRGDGRGGVGAGGSLRVLGWLFPGDDVRGDLSGANDRTGALRSLRMRHLHARLSMGVDERRVAGVLGRDGERLGNDRLHDETASLERTFDRRERGADRAGDCLLAVGVGHTRRGDA